MTAEKGGHRWTQINTDRKTQNSDPDPNSLSTVMMPAGVPVGTLAIGKAGAINAALLAAGFMGNTHPEIRERLKQFRKEQTAKVMEDTYLEV